MFFYSYRINTLYFGKNILFLYDPDCEVIAISSFCSYQDMSSWDRQRSKIPLKI